MFWNLWSSNCLYTQANPNMASWNNFRSSRPCFKHTSESHQNSRTCAHSVFEYRYTRTGLETTTASPEIANNTSACNTTNIVIRARIQLPLRTRICEVSQGQVGFPIFAEVLEPHVFRPHLEVDLGDVVAEWRGAIFRTVPDAYDVGHHADQRQVCGVLAAIYIWGRRETITTPAAQKKQDDDDNQIHRTWRW